MGSQQGRDSIVKQILRFKHLDMIRKYWNKIITSFIESHAKSHSAGHKSMSPHASFHVHTYWSSEAKLANVIRGSVLKSRKNRVADVHRWYEGSTWVAYPWLGQTPGSSGGESEHGSEHGTGTGANCPLSARGRLGGGRTKVVTWSAGIAEAWQVGLAVTYTPERHEPVIWLWLSVLTNK